MELADAVEGIVRHPVPLLACHGEHVAQRRKVPIDGRGAASVSVGQCASLDRGARRPGLCACEGFAGELAAVLDQNGRGHVGELQVAEVLFPPGQIRAGGAAVALLRDLFIDVAIDCLTERTPSASTLRKCRPSIMSASMVLAQRSAMRRVGKLAVRVGKPLMRTWT